MKLKRISMLLAIMLVSTMIMGGISALAAPEDNAPPASLNFVVVNDLNNLKDSDLTGDNCQFIYGDTPGTAELVTRDDNVLFQITASADGHHMVPRIVDLFNIGHVKTLNGGNDPWGLGFYIETAGYEVQFLQTYLSEVYGNALNKSAYLFDLDGYLVDYLPEVDSSVGLFIPKEFKGYLLFEMVDTCDYSSETAEGFSVAVWWMQDMFEGDSFIMDNFGYVTAAPEMKDKNSETPTTSPEEPTTSPEEPVASPSEAPASPAASPSKDAASPSPSVQAASPSPSAAETSTPEDDNTFLIIAICAAAVIVIAVIVFVVIKKGKKSPKDPTDTPANDNQ